jgi:TPR repeat protein
MADAGLKRKHVLLALLGLTIAGYVVVLVIFGFPLDQLPVINGVRHSDAQYQGDESDIARFLPQAEKGDAKAQFSLALRYERHAETNAEDIQKAIYWYRKAAAQGHGGALNNLGSIYRQGTGGVKNGEESVLFYTLAASDSDSNAGYRSDAQANLCQAWFHGLGVAPDAVLAKHYCLLTAPTRPTIGALRLAVLYAIGFNGTNSDINAALQWADKAVAAGTPKSKEIQAALRDYFAHTNQGMTAEQAFVELTLQLARQGWAMAQMAAGMWYLTGTHVAANGQESGKWLTQAARHNFVDAQLVVGALCLKNTVACGGATGDAASKGRVEAYKWLSLATMQHETAAAEMLDGLRKKMSVEEIVLGERIVALSAATQTE